MSSSSGAAGCTCTWGPDATSRRGGSQLGPWPRLTPSRGRPCGGCGPLSASSRSCGSSTATARTRTTTRSRETTHPRLTGRSARRRRAAAARPAGAGSDRTAAAGRWPSSPGAWPRCAPRDTRGRVTSGRSPRSDSPTAPRDGRGQEAEQGVWLAAAATSTGRHDGEAQPGLLWEQPGQSAMRSGETAGSMRPFLTESGGVFRRDDASARYFWQMSDTARRRVGQPLLGCDLWSQPCPCQRRRPRRFQSRHQTILREINAGTSYIDPMT